MITSIRQAVRESEGHITMIVRVRCAMCIQYTLNAPSMDDDDDEAAVIIFHEKMLNDANNLLAAHINVKHIFQND